MKGILFSAIEIDLDQYQNPEKAKQMRAYMKDHFPYFGIQSPIRRQVVNDNWKNHKLGKLEHLYDFVSKCWDQNEREWQYVGMDVAGKCKKLYNETTITFAEKLITSKSWWDTVDWIASHMVGHCFKKYPDLRDKKIELWMASDDIWLQRTCLIFQLKYKEDTDFNLMRALILDLKSSKEFFIQKGAGWALRQYSKFRPDLVKEFIESNPDLPSLTKREGLKYC